MKIYDFVVKDNKDCDVSLEEYRGKVLLIVNTATECGFTPQYGALQDLYDKYREQGFEILDFPCNQFAGQAPGTASEIADFCETRFGVTFRQFAKVNVNGRDAAPLFKYLKDQKHSLFGRKIKWNFTKFLVDRDGKVISRFAPITMPQDFEDEVSSLLAKK